MDISKFLVPIDVTFLELSRMEVQLCSQAEVYSGCGVIGEARKYFNGHRAPPSTRQKIIA